MMGDGQECGACRRSLRNCECKPEGQKFRATAKCRTNFMPGTLEPNRDGLFTINVESEPMTCERALKLIEVWKAAIPTTGWVFDVEPVT